MQSRSPTLQSVSWFVDLFRNGQLNLSPTYQRLSFWNDDYRAFFIDTLLTGYPMPAVFLHREIDDDGRTTYSVVDGKQRIETILQFAHFKTMPVPASVPEIAGLTFDELSREARQAFWSYQVPVELMPETSEPVLKDIFDRFNRNVGKLRPQELRHARFDGAFASLAERAARRFPDGLPGISEAERRRMKDVEYAALLLLFLAHGPVATSQRDLDQKYADWDGGVPNGDGLESRFAHVQDSIKAVVAREVDGQSIGKTRYRNLSDYYSLFGAVANLLPTGWKPDHQTAGRLLAFARRVEAVRIAELAHDPAAAAADPLAARYYGAIRAASNDATPRGIRIAALEEVLRRAPQ